MEMKGTRLFTLHGWVVLVRREICVYFQTFFSFSLCAVAFSSYAKENRCRNPFFFKLEQMLLWAPSWAHIHRDGT